MFLFALLSILIFQRDTLATMQSMQTDLESFWHQVKAPTDPTHKILWSPRLSPPFPTEWPWQGKMIQAFAYATGKFDKLRDGVKVTETWGDVTWKPLYRESQARLKLRRPHPRDLGFQGVRPTSPPALKAEDVEPYWVKFADDLRSGKPPHIPAEFKEYYCFWWRGNGVVASTLPTHVKQFVDSLDCS